MNEEVRRLVLKARRSLKAAQRNFQEGDYDFSASRAYYAMFYMAEGALLAKGASYSKHSGVIAGFWEQFVKPGIFPQELHQFLHAGFTNRNIGDYDYRVDFPRDEAERMLAHADRFLRDVHAYLAKEGWLSA
jgi:uncharacterized protein (UPF0332 family)